MLMILIPSRSEIAGGEGLLVYVPIVRKEKSQISPLPTLCPWQHARCTGLWRARAAVKVPPKPPTALCARSTCRPVSNTYSFCGHRSTAATWRVTLTGNAGVWLVPWGYTLPGECRPECGERVVGPLPSIRVSDWGGEKKTNFTWYTGPLGKLFLKCLSVS